MLLVGVLVIPIGYPDKPAGSRVESPAGARLSDDFAIVRISDPNNEKVRSLSVNQITGIIFAKDDVTKRKLFGLSWGQYHIDLATLIVSVWAFHRQIDSNEVAFTNSLNCTRQSASVCNRIISCQILSPLTHGSLAIQAGQSGNNYVSNNNFRSVSENHHIASGLALPYAGDESQDGKEGSYSKQGDGEPIRSLPPWFRLRLSILLFFLGCWFFYKMYRPLYQYLHWTWLNFYMFGVGVFVFWMSGIILFLNPGNW